MTNNPRVEQKNSTLVRKYLGHDRIDSVVQVLALNQLYDKMWLYYNLFQPVMHLAEKEVIREDGKPSNRAGRVGRVGGATGGSNSAQSVPSRS
jgi:hypothetical protein